VYLIGTKSRRNIQKKLGADMCATITESLSFSTYIFLQDLATIIEEKYRTCHTCSFHFNGRLVHPVILLDSAVYC
jgi:hypothetical protein